MYDAPGWVGRGAHEKIPSLVAERSPARHAQRRRPWNRAFAPAALKEYEPSLRRRVMQLVELLGKQEGVLDLAVWIHRFSCVLLSAARAFATLSCLEC